MLRISADIVVINLPFGVAFSDRRLAGSYYFSLSSFAAFMILPQ